MESLEAQIFSLIVAVLCLVFGSYWAEKRYPSATFYLRKALHIGVISLVAVLTPLMNNGLLFIIAFLTSVVLFVSIKRGWFAEVQMGGTKRKSWGIVYFAITFTLFNACLWWIGAYNPIKLREAQDVVKMALLVLAFSDGLAGVYGRFYAPYLEKSLGIDFRVKMGNDQKSWVGFLVFVLSSFFILSTYFYGLECFSQPGDFWFWLPVILLFSVGLALVEMLSSGGSDNLFVPISVCVFALFFYDVRSSNSPLADWSYLLFSSCAAAFLVRFKWLDVSGAAMAWLLAFVVVFMAEWSLWPLAVFMAVGVISEKQLKYRLVLAVSDEKDAKSRDHWQVLANVGVFMLLASISYLVGNKWFCDMLGLDIGVDALQDKLGLLALVSVAVSCSDTMSSTIGKAFGGEPRDILTFKKVNRGLSGGVTAYGFFGALIGAAIIAAFTFVENGTFLFSIGGLRLFLKVLMFGILGSLVDSILGKLFQAKYQSSSGGFSDVPNGLNTNVLGGFGWCSNDWVNFFSGVLTIIFFLVWG